MKYTNITQAELARRGKCSVSTIKRYPHIITVQDRRAKDFKRRIEDAHAYLSLQGIKITRSALAERLGISERQLYRHLIKLKEKPFNVIEGKMSLEERKAILRRAGMNDEAEKLSK